METRLIPVIDATGLRQYLDVPGRSYFEGAWHINGLLGDVVKLDRELLLLTEREVEILDKQTECKEIRRQLRELYYQRENALSAGRRTDKIMEKFNSLNARLFRLEREIKKNADYELIDKSIADIPPSDQYGDPIGRCLYCDKVVYKLQIHPNPTEEGLFCDYRHRTLHRKEIAAKQPRE